MFFLNSHESFEKFLLKTSIGSLCDLTKKTPDEGTIHKLARVYLESPAQKRKDDLKAKSWFLLPKEAHSESSDALLRALTISRKVKEDMLRAAAKEGEEWRINHLKNAGIDLERQKKKLLVLACARGNKNLVKALLSEVPNIKFTDKFQNTLLHKAADNPKIGALLIKAGINVNSPNSKGETPLHRACAEGNYNLAYKLIKFGADIHIPDNKGFTPLHHAFRHGHIKIGARLLEEGAELSVFDEADRTPLDYLREIDEGNAIHFLRDYCTKTREDLISAAIDFGFSTYALNLLKSYPSADLNRLLNTYDSSHLTPLLRAIFHSPPDPKLIQFLLSHGANPNQVDMLGTPPLINAINNSPIDLAILKTLRDHGADFAFKDSEGLTALHWAVSNASYQAEVIDFLIKENPISVNAQTEQGSTPLHLACRSSRSLKLVEQLLEHGANPHIEDKTKIIPLEEAVRSPLLSPKIIHLLIKAGSPTNLISEEMGVRLSALIRMRGLRVLSQTEKYDEEYVLRNLLAGSWGISNHVSSLEGRQITFEGGLREIAEQENLKLLKKFKSYMGISNLEQIFQIIEEGFEASHKPPGEISALFKMGKPLIFNTGSLNHALSVVMYEDYMLVCNRGAGRKKPSICAFKINRKAFDLDASLIDKMQKVGASPDNKDLEFFYDILPVSLGYKKGEEKDFLCQLIEDKCQQKDQKSGNCWWLSPKNADMALIMIKGLTDLRKAHPAEIPPSHYYELLDSCESLFKHYSEFTRLAILKKYLHRPVELSLRDHELIKKISSKLQSKKWRHLLNSESTVIWTAFISLLQGKGAQLPLFTKKEVNEWLQHYKEQYHLNEAFERVA